MSVCVVSGDGEVGGGREGDGIKHRSPNINKRTPRPNPDRNNISGKEINQICLNKSKSP